MIQQTNSKKIRNMQTMWQQMFKQIDNKNNQMNEKQTYSQIHKHHKIKDTTNV